MFIISFLQKFFEDSFMTFNPEIEITPLEGKVFNPENLYNAGIFEIKGIDVIAETIEENVLIKDDK